MNTYTLYTQMDLHLFEGDGGATPGGEAAPAAGGKEAPANVVYGKQAQEEAPREAAQPDAQEKAHEATPAVDVEARKAEFERLIKGEYKDLFHERTQKIIDARFKQTKALEAQAEALKPMLGMLADKYGVSGDDVEGLVKAIEEDDSYYEEEAMNKGLTVEQLKHMKRLERENAEFRRVAEERERRANAERTLAAWHDQAEKCGKAYPNFSLQAEISNPETGGRFLSLLKSGVDVQTAFEVIHKDDVIGGAMQYTAQAIQQKTVNDIRARGMRPAENGGSGTAAAVINKPDPSTWTREERDRAARIALREGRYEI